MKNVFTNNQLCHVWANQSQKEGRSDNIFFENTEIYSYGRHYMLGKIYRTKSGKLYALINSKRYSNTTVKHTYCTIDALKGLMPWFYASDVTKPTKVLTELEAEAKASINDSLNTKIIKTKISVKWAIENIQSKYKTLNEFRRLLGKKGNVKPKTSDLAKVKNHYEARLKRWHELNTPKAIAKREDAAFNRKIRANNLALKKQAENIQRFRNGEINTISGLDYDLIRVINNDIVVTSRGAQVPLTDALDLLQDIVGDLDVVGTSCGQFRVNSVQEFRNTPNEKVIKIGCHKILLSEATIILGPYLEYSNVTVLNKNQPMSEL
jgi:hypothetical protein